MNEPPETALPAELVAPTLELLLTVADDKLLLGHANSEWTGLAPILEEDIAFSSLAQDEIAHAQELYQLAAPLAGRTADQLAFGREPTAFRCAQIVEIPDEFDWAVAIARQLLCDHFDALRLERMANSTWKPLADLSARLAAEEQVHVEHADAWVRRLGQATDDARQRLQAALDELSVFTPGLFERFEGEQAIEAAGIYPAGDRPMAQAWSSAIQAVTSDAGLQFKLPDVTPGIDGRRGHHSKHLAPLLGEMSEVFRLEPDAAW